MNAALEARRTICLHPPDAILEACVLEATAPKVGNVYPGKDFDGLTYQDFVSAANLTACAFEENAGPFSTLILESARSISQQLRTNVNLGILLLIGPLYQAERDHPDAVASLGDWSSVVREVLDSMTPEDSQRMYQAINLSAPGGIGNVEDHDLSGPAPNDFLDAMRAAKDRDQIAADYCNGFSHLFHQVVPTLADQFANHDNVLVAISRAQLSLLSRFPDTLIARKFGSAVADQVQQRAGIGGDDEQAVDQLDRFLRDGCADLTGRVRNLNPGTTADFIAAGLYVLLRIRDLEQLSAAAT